MRLTGPIPRRYAGLVQSNIPHFDLSRVKVVRGSALGAVFGFLGQSAVTVRGVIHLTPRGVRRIQANDAEALDIFAHHAYHVVQQRNMRWTTWLAVYAFQAAVTMDWRGFRAHARKFAAGVRRCKLHMVPIPWNVRAMPLERRAREFSLHVLKSASAPVSGAGRGAE